MGIPAWIWFVIAAVALVAALTLLAVDRNQESSHHRERIRWADLRGWQFLDEDERLAQQWAGGAMGYFGAEAAINVVSGSTFTSDGRRPVFVFDIEADGHIPAVVVAVRCNRVHQALVELWLASVPFQRAEMPELLGPVGQRYAFADDTETAQTLITQDLVDAADALGGDVGVVWLENEWVLASVVPNAGPSRLERLLRDLGEIADIVDPFDDSYGGGQHWQAYEHDGQHAAQQLPQGAAAQYGSADYGSAAHDSTDYNGEYDLPHQDHYHGYDDYAQQTAHPDHSPDYADHPQDASAREHSGAHQAEQTNSKVNY